MRLFVLYIGLMMVVVGVATADATKQGINCSFRLPDVRTSRAVALSDFAGKKAVVVIFMGTACPVNNAYMAVLASLSKKYETAGVQFVGINSNPGDGPAEVAAHAQRYELPFPVLKDSTGKVAEQFGARRVPEVFVLNEERQVVYRGRIDDQVGIDYRRPKPTKQELVDTLEALIQNRPVQVKETEAVGCLITRQREEKNDSQITYTKQVARILQKHCQECHRPGQIGPFPLLTYEHAANWSAMIREVVTEKRMPPWFADPHIGQFANDRSLPPADRSTLLAWIDAGCPKGDERDLPEPVQWPEGWRIGQPDVVFEMREAYPVPAETPAGGVPYKYFVIDTNFEEDQWIERAEARPGAPEVVHHIIAFVVPPLGSDEPTPLGPPLLPPLVANAKKATVLCGTAPGDMPTILPLGYAKRVPKKAKIVLQMHYTPNGKAQADRSKIGLIFAKQPPRYEVQTVPILNSRFVIPPGASNHQVESWGPTDSNFKKVGFPREVEIVSFMPHMHLRGKDFFIEAVYPDGRKQPLLSVPRYNFNWQNAYVLASPLRLPAGAKLHCIAHFDNSADNPNNPDPTKPVRWGDQTWQEMMIGWTDFAVERPAQSGKDASPRP
jgi:peroxiredoxin